MKKISCIIGTRPEAIKMAPVVMRLRKSVNEFETALISTGQHRDILNNSLACFGLQVDADLKVMEENQSLSSLTARVFIEFDKYLLKERPDFVLVQGDTTTVMVASVACFYRRIPFGHVEAGLRTGNIQYPFPEEFNRRVATLVASLHFCPTKAAARALYAEGIPKSQIVVTGNTVIDALYVIRDKNPTSKIGLPDKKKIILFTAHRRENFGARLQGIFEAVLDVLDAHPDAFLVYPVHPNPNVRNLAHSILGGHRSVLLCAPLDYSELVALMLRAEVILTDSGGIQEEAPALGKPVLVLRDETERPEAVSLGAARLVGVDRARIYRELSTLLEDQNEYRKMVIGYSPYGDGHASERIADALHAYFAS